LHKNCKKLQKIELFLKLLSKIGGKQGFGAILWHITGTLGGIQDVQKIALFLGNFGKKCSKPRK